MLDFNVENNEGVIAPINPKWLVDAVMIGEPVPLGRCDKQDAWRYRRRMVEVAGTL